MIIQLKELILFLFLLSGTKERISLPWKRWKRLASPTSSRTWPSRSVLNVAALDMNQHVNNFTFIGWVLFFFFNNVLEVVKLCRSFIKMHSVHYLLLTPLDFVYFGIFHEFLLFWNSL
jgi:acyl-ACP thioesterase